MTSHAKPPPVLAPPPPVGLPAGLSAGPATIIPEPGAGPTDIKTDVAVLVPISLEATPRRLKVTPKHGMPLFAHTQGIMIKPGVETDVEEDSWVRSQLDAQYLLEI